jgi:hypothetical protein
VGITSVDDERKRQKTTESESQECHMMQHFSDDPDDLDDEEVRDIRTIVPDGGSLRVPTQMLDSVQAFRA